MRHQLNWIIFIIMAIWCFNLATVYYCPVVTSFPSLAGGTGLHKASSIVEIDMLKGIGHSEETAVQNMIENANKCLPYSLIALALSIAALCLYPYPRVRIIFAGCSILVFILMFIVQIEFT